jgi:hypothetical protein
VDGRGKGCGTRDGAGEVRLDGCSITFGGSGRSISLGGNGFSITLDGNGFGITLDGNRSRISLGGNGCSATLGGNRSCIAFCGSVRSGIRHIFYRHGPRDPVDEACACSVKSEIDAS